MMYFFFMSHILVLLLCSKTLSTRIQRSLMLQKAQIARCSLEGLTAALFFIPFQTWIISFSTKLKPNIFVGGQICCSLEI